MGAASAITQQNYVTSHAPIGRSDRHCQRDYRSRHLQNCRHGHRRCPAPLAGWQTRIPTRTVILTIATLALLFSGSRGFAIATATIYVHNTGSQNVYVRACLTDGYWGTQTFDSLFGGPVVPGGTLGGSAVLDLTHNATVTIYVDCNGPVAGCGGTAAGTVSVIAANLPATYDINVTCNGAPPPTYTWSGCITNDTAYPIAVETRYSFPTGPAGSSGCTDLAPGGVKCNTFSTTNGPFTGGWVVTGGSCAHPAPPYGVYPPTGSYTNSPPGNGDNRGVNPGAPGPPPGSSPPGGGNPPPWDRGSIPGGTNTILSGDIQLLAGNIDQALGHLASTLLDTNGLAHEETVGQILFTIGSVTGILTHIDSGGFDMRVILTNTLNTVGQIATNTYNQLGEADRLLTNISTILSNGIPVTFSNGLFSATNFLGTSNILAEGWTNALYVGGQLGNGFTNGMEFSAAGASNRAWGGGGGGITNLGNGLSGLAGAFSTGTWASGSSDPLHIAMFGQTLSFDIEDQVSGIWAWAKLTATILIIIFYTTELAKIIIEADTMMAAMQTGGIANMETLIAGTGGNILGMTMFALTCSAVTALMYLVIDAFLPAHLSDMITYVSSSFSQLWSGSAVPAGPAGSGTKCRDLVLFLADKVIPVSLAISVIISTISLRLVGGKVFMVVNIACRFLPGK